MSEVRQRNQSNNAEPNKENGQKIEFCEKLIISEFRRVCVEICLNSSN